MIESNYYYACVHPFLGMTVHCKGCKKLQQEGQVFLGSFYEYYHAVAVARRRYSGINRCSECLGMKPEIEPAVVVKSRTRIKPPVTVKTRVEPKANINRVPTKHTPGNY